MLHLSIKPDFARKTILGVVIYTYSTPLQLPLPIIPIFCRSSTIRQILLNGSNCSIDALFPVNHSLLYSARKASCPSKQHTSLLDLQDLVYTSRTVRYRVGDFFLDLSSILPQFALTEQIKASNAVMSKLVDAESSRGSQHGSSAIPRFTLATITLVFETHNSSLFASYPSISNLMTGRLSTLLLVGATENAADWLPVPLFSMSIRHSITVQFSCLPEGYRPICGGRMAVCRTASSGRTAASGKDPVGYLFTDITGNVHKLCFLVARADGILYMHPTHTADVKDLHGNRRSAASVHSLSALKIGYNRAMELAKTTSIYELAATPIVQRIFASSHTVPESDCPSLNLVCYTLINMRQYDISPQIYTLYKAFSIVIDFLALTPFKGRNFNIAVLFDGTGRVMVGNNILILPLMPCNYTEVCISYLKLISEVLARYVFGVHIPAADYASQPACLVLQQALTMHLRHALLGTVDMQRMYYEASIRGAAGISAVTPTLWHQHLPSDVEERYNPGQSYLHHVKATLYHGLYGTPMNKIDGIWEGAGRTSKALTTSPKKSAIKAPATITHAEAVYNFLDTSFGTSYCVTPATATDSYQTDGGRDQSGTMRLAGSPKMTVAKVRKGKRASSLGSGETDAHGTHVSTTVTLKETNQADTVALTALPSRWFNPNILYNLDFLHNLYQPVLVSNFSQLEILNKHAEGIAHKTVTHSKGLSGSQELVPDELEVPGNRPPSPSHMTGSFSQIRSNDAGYGIDDAGTDLGFDIDSQSAASFSGIGGGNKSGANYSVCSSKSFYLTAAQRAALANGGQCALHMSEHPGDGDYSAVMPFIVPGGNSRNQAPEALQLDADAMSLMYFYINEPFFPIGYAVPEKKLHVRAEIIGLTIRNNLTAQGLQAFFRKFLKMEYVQTNLLFKYLDEVCFNRHFFTGGTWLKTVTESMPDTSTKSGEALIFPDPSLTVLPDTGENSINATVLKGAAGAGVGFAAEQYRLSNEALHLNISSRDSFHSNSPNSQFEGVIDDSSKGGSIYKLWKDQLDGAECSESSKSQRTTSHPFTVLVHKLGITTSNMSITYHYTTDNTDTSQFTERFSISFSHMNSGLIDTLKDTRTKMGLPLINRGEVTSGCRRLLLLPDTEAWDCSSDPCAFAARINSLSLGADGNIYGINYQHGESRNYSESISLKGSSSNLYASIHMLQQPSKSGSSGSGTLSFNLLTGISTEFFEDIRAQLSAGHNFYNHIKTEKFAHIIVDPYSQMPFAYKHHYTNENDQDNNCYLPIAKVDCERDIAVQLEALNSLCYNCVNTTVPLLLGILYSESVAPVLQETAFKMLIYKITRDNYYEVTNKEMHRLEEQSKNREHRRWILLLNTYFFNHRRLLQVYPRIPDEGDDGKLAVRYDFECIKKLGIGSLISYALLCGYVSISKVVDLLELLNMDNDTISSNHTLTIAVLQGLTWQMIRKVITVEWEMYTVLLLLIKLVLSSETMTAVRQMALCSLTLIVSTAWESPAMATMLIGLLNEKGLISEKTKLLVRHTLGSSEVLKNIGDIPATCATKNTTKADTLCNCCNCCTISENSSLTTFVALRVIFVHLLLDLIEVHTERARSPPEDVAGLGTWQCSSASVDTFTNKELLEECFWCITLMGADNCMAFTATTHLIVQPLSHQFITALYRGTTYTQVHSMDTANVYAMSNTEALIFMMTYVYHLFTLPLNEAQQVEWKILRGCPICLVNGSCKCIRINWPAVRSKDSKTALKRYVTVRCILSDFFTTYENNKDKYASFEEYFDNTYKDQDPITSSVFENGRLVTMHLNSRNQPYDMMLFKRIDRIDKDNNSTNPDPRPNSCYPEFMLPCLYSTDTGINRPNYLFRQCLFDAAGCVVGQSVATRMLDMLIYPAGKQWKKRAADASVDIFQYDFQAFKRASHFGDDLPLLLLNAISVLHGANLIRYVDDMQYDSEVGIRTLGESQKTQAFKDTLLSAVHEHSEYVNIMATFCEENLTPKSSANDNVSKAEHNMGYLIHARYEPARDQFRGTVLRFAGYVIGYLAD